VGDERDERANNSGWMEVGDERDERANNSGWMKVGRWRGGWQWVER